ncbi:hypothetical protein MWH28_12715 [Natroniella sulfidigena]|uniref:TapB family protein n=1 Tax=Natroniella sulfidigena TaxID=723921 RepID=UPI002009E5FE|nr:hypothetical protein [Natroniella sulfidigena]MCK8818220.1 hypothetical protein [Natroniella sulfidigena]
MTIPLIIGGCAPGEGEQEPPPQEEQEEEVGEGLEEFNLKAYLPLQEGMTYDFTGEGPIHPSLEREIMFTEEPYVQILDKGTGTNIVLVYEVQEDQIGKIIEEAEFYEEDNLIEELDEEPEVQEVILQEPLEEGATWETNDQQREIVAINETITVPAGTFYDVIQIRIISLNEEDNNETYHYYAKNVGLIKQETIGEDFERILELESYGNREVDE